jgi:hypothetical protein
MTMPGRGSVAQIREDSVMVGKLRRSPAFCWPDRPVQMSWASSASLAPDRVSNSQAESVSMTTPQLPDETLLLLSAGVQITVTRGYQ